MSDPQSEEDKARLEAAAALPPLHWRCFHCDDVFTDWGQARNHFGYSPNDGPPTCKTTRGHDAEIYHLKRRLELYQSEDTELHRQIHSMSAAHATELRRQEELGYERGLRDGRALGPEEETATTGDAA